MRIYVVLGAWASQRKWMVMAFNDEERARRYCASVQAEDDWLAQQRKGLEMFAPVPENRYDAGVQEHEKGRTTYYVDNVNLFMEDKDGR